MSDIEQQLSLHRTEMLRLTNLILPLHHPDEAVPAAIIKWLRVTPRDLVRHQIVRRGHDARDKANILLVYTVDVTLRDEAKVLARHSRVAMSSGRLTRPTAM